MTWTNVFDLGECTVIVNDDNGDQIFSQVMAKGDTVAFDAPSMEASFDIAVSAGGEVSISGVQFGGGGGRISVMVVPSDVDGPMRLSGIVADLGNYGTSTAIAFGEFQSSDFVVPLSGDESGWTPDPCDLLDGSNCLGILAEATGV